MRFLIPALIVLLSACEAATGPDARDGFSDRNIGNTVVTHVDQLGTQVVHMSNDGKLFLWSSAGPDIQLGDWKFDILATGAATTYQGAGGINHPVQELETAWGICFRYRDAAGTILRRLNGGDWNCALLQDYEALVVERGPGDMFRLAAAQPREPLPERVLLTLAQIQRL